MRLFRLRLIGLAICVLACVYTASAQNVVTGTIHDPNGNAYANGSASALLAVVSGQVQPPSTNVTTNAAGFFTMTLATGSYSFIICAAPTGLPPVNPVANPTPKQICFQSAPILINTNPQDVSTTLNAIALSLGPQGSSAGGVTNPSSLNNIIFVDGVTYKTINAAVAAVTAPGTIIVPSNACATCVVISSPLTLPNNVTLQIYPQTITANATITINKYSGIQCLSPAPMGIASDQPPCMIKAGNGTNLAAVVIMNSALTFLDDVVIDGNKANNPTGGVAVKVNQANRTEIERVTVQNAPTHGIWAVSGANNSGQPKWLKLMANTNNGDGLFISSTPDVFLNQSELENNGTSATVNTTNTTITATSGSWSTDSSLVGIMVRVNNAGMCKVLAVPSTTTMTVAAATCWNMSGVSTALGVQTGVPLSFGNGWEGSDSPTPRIVDTDFGGNKMDGFLAFGTAAGLGAFRPEISGANQFGNNFQNDVEIIGSGTGGADQATAVGTGVTVVGNAFIGSTNRTPGNTYDAIKLVDGGSDEFASNILASSGSTNNAKCAVEASESSSGRFAVSQLIPDELNTSFGTASWCDNTANGAYGVQIPHLGSSGSGTSSSLDLFDITSAASAPHKFFRVKSGNLEVMNNSGTVVYRLTDGGQIQLTAAGMLISEQACPGPSSGNDMICANSTAHALQISNNNGTFFNAAQVLTATSAAFATATTAGTCATPQVTSVPGATTAMAVSVSPVSTPGVGAVWSAYVSSAGNVTINECAVATSTGGTIAFNIRVTP